MDNRQTVVLRLLEEHDQKRRSWRRIAREDYRDKVDQATLSRIARTNGEYFPVDTNIIAVLQSPRVKEKKPKRIPRHGCMLDYSARQLRYMLFNREPMP